MNAAMTDSTDTRDESLYKLDESCRRVSNDESPYKLDESSESKPQRVTI